MSAPWMKFYPRDWRGDQALRAVSIAARGLWIECLCIMHEAKPYGHLVLNGDPVGDDTLARMTGISVELVADLVSELRKAGVLSVTREGVVFSRRMTKDHARARKGRNAAKLRWSQVADGVEQSAAPNGSPNWSPITQKPDTRLKEDARASLSEAPSDLIEPIRKRGEYPPDFEAMWKAYPTDRLMSKKAAGKAWSRMSASAREMALASAEAFKAYCAQHPTYRAVHLVKYLNEERFVGFSEAAAKASGTVFVAQGSASWRAWQQVRRTPAVKSESGGVGWWFPAEWPPSENARAA